MPIRDEITREKHLIIVPGWLQTSEHWKATATELPDWNIHVIDLPGFGTERLRSSEWGVPEYATFVANALVKIPLPQHARVVAIGHSFGGRILASLYGSDSEPPVPLEALILYAAPCLYRPTPWVRMRIAAARFAKKIGLVQLLPDTLKPYDLRQATDAGMGAIFKRSVPFSLENELAHITVPTHIVWGELDTSVPLRIANEMHTRIEQSTLTTIPGEGHNMHIDNPRLFFGTLRRILSRSEPYEKS